MVAVDSVYVPVRDEPEAQRLAALSDGLRVQFLTTEEVPQPLDQGESVAESAEDSENGSTAEWLQHLVALGYLDAEDAVGGTEAGRRRRRRAFALLAEDLADASDLAGGPALKNELDEGVSGEPPGPLALMVVEQLLAFDGGSPVPPTLAAGDRGLWSRVLHHRLSAFGLFTRPVADAVGPTTLLALRRLDHLLTPGRRGGSGATARSLSEILGDLHDATGDIETLLRRFTATLGVTPLAFHDAASDWESRADFDTLRIEDGAFVNTSAFSIGHILDLFSDREGAEPSFRGSVEERAGDPESRFGLGLLQIALWTAGYYGGRLDGWWGELSHRAVRELVRDRGDRLEDVVLGLGRGYFAVNPQAALPVLYGSQARSREAAAAEADFVTAELEGQDLEPERPPRRGFWAGLRKGLRAALSLGRRVLTSAASLARAIGNGVRRGIRAIRRAVGGALQAVGGVFAYIYRGVREVVRLIRRGMAPFVHFVLRRPIWTLDATGRPLAVTDHDLDRDVVHWVAPWASPGQTAAHARLVRRLARALDLILALVVGALDIVRSMAFPPAIGWVRVAIKIVGLLRRLFGKRAMAA